jgi:succinate dehydrogenase / fumarate reductase cytochrome b subunit
MAAKSALLKSSLAKKYWMSLTGLFLCLFLVVHLAGNLQLLNDPAIAGPSFNAYTEFMSTFPLIKISSYLLYFSILFHAVDGILILSRENKAARPVSYAYSKPQNNSIWASRNMGVLGTAILVFIVLHMGNFWFKYKFTELPMGPGDLPDMYGLVVASFKEGWYTAIYVVSMIVLGFHLWHGFESAFQTLGLNHKKYSPLVKSLGKIFAVVVPALFAIIPVYIFLNL